MIEENRQQLAELRRAAGLLQETALGSIPGLVAAVATQLHDRADEIGAQADGVQMTAPMVVEGVRNVTRGWRDADLLRRMRWSELEGSGHKPLLPQVVFANLAGNLFVSAWETVFQCWLLGAAVFARVPVGSNCLLPVLAEVAVEVNPLLGQMLNFGHWSAAQLEVTEAAINDCDSAIIFGGDEAIRELTPLIPWHMPRRLHGGAYSFAVIDEVDVSVSLAREVAYDVCVYDQAGCLNPKLIVWVGEWGAAEEFAEMLGREMHQLELSLPRRELNLAERAAVARDRDAVLLTAAMGKRGKVVSDSADPFQISVVEGGDFTGTLPESPRHACIMVARDYGAVVEMLSRYRGQISTLGVSDAAPSQFAQLVPLKPSRVCPVGMMQRPQFGWSHDGQRSLMSLVRWQGVE